MQTPCEVQLRRGHARITARHDAVDTGFMQISRDHLGFSLARDMQHEGPSSIASTDQCVRAATRTRAHTHTSLETSGHCKHSSVDGIFIATTSAHTRTKGKTTRGQAQVPRTPEVQCWRQADGSRNGTRCNNLFRAGGGCLHHCSYGKRTSTDNTPNIELGGEGGSHRRCAQIARK